MLTPVSASFRRATASARLARTAATLLLNEAGFERGGDAACGFDLTEQGPGGAAKLIGQIFDGAGARRRIGDLVEMRFFAEEELGIAGDPARKPVGQAARGGERQTR